MVPIFGVVIVLLLMWSSYRTIARVFKWLTLVLLAYVLTAFVARVDRRLALQMTLIPHMEWSRAFFSVLAAILGTTISPYLFFWQAAQEVEEERAMGRNLARRRGATPEELHAHGKTNIATAQEAAEALRPLAGAGAYWLFLGAAMALGIALNYAGLNAIKLLFTSAVINGVLAPPLILIVLLLTGDRTVMGDAINSRAVACLGWLTFVVMVVAPHRQDHGERPRQPGKTRRHGTALRSRPARRPQTERLFGRSFALLRPITGPTLTVRISGFV
jgi:Mn2+/Fe2+ NRAMP family transporter